MRRRVVVAVSVLTLSGLAACVPDTSNPLAPVPDAGHFELDGATPRFDAGRDAAQPAVDAGTDSTLSEASTPDTSVADTNVDDTGLDVVVVVVDAGTDAVSDTGIDAGLDAGYDAGADATIDAGVDAAPVDAGVDAAPADAGVDAAPADAGPKQCAVDVFGDYYLRNDGTVVYMVGSQNVVMSSITGLPLGNVVTVAPQDNHACALLSDKTVWCWASNSNGDLDGDLGDGTINGNPTLFSATQVVTQPADAGAAYLTNVVAIEEGSGTYYTHPTCVIRGDHTVWCWGVSGANGGPPTGMFWGTTGSTASVPFAFPIASGPAPGDGGAAPILLADKLTVGLDSICTLSAGQVQCLGADIAGNLGDNSTDSHSTGNFHAYPVSVMATNGFPANVTDLASGARFTCALGNGGVWCWGVDAMAGDPGAPHQVCNSNYCQPVPVPVQVALADGGATSFPDAGLDQSPLTNVTALTSTYQASCALDNVGTLRCWGSFISGSTATPEATIYNSGGAPSSNIAKMTMSPEQGDINSGVRYLTQSGVLVSRQTVITQVCP